MSPVNSAALTVQRCRAKNWLTLKTNITVIDSESVTVGLGIISISAARLSLLNESLNGILEDIKQTKMNIHLLGVLDTLKYLALGGRIAEPGRCSAVSSM